MSRNISYALIGWFAGIVSVVILGLVWPFVFPGIVNIDHYYGAGPSLPMIIFIATLIIGCFPWYTGKGSLIIAAPSLAAILVAFLVDGWEGVKEIFRRLGRWRSNWKWYVLVMFSPANS